MGFTPIVRIDVVYLAAGEVELLRVGYCAVAFEHVVVVLAADGPLGTNAVVGALDVGVADLSRGILCCCGVAGEEAGCSEQELHVGGSMGLGLLVIKEDDEVAGN